MAQTIIGLDIGSFSVKVSTVTASFRSFSWDGYREYEIPHAGRARPERAAAQVLADLGKEVTGPGAAVVCALPGDRVMTRFIQLPFSDPKRIDSVLGFELEGQIPLGVEDINYSYQPVGETDDGQTEIFAAAVKHDVMERYLEGLEDAGIDPRVLTLDTISYLNLYDHLVGEGTVAFVDIGHRTTKLCIVEEGRLRLARSIGRGGQAVTQAIAEKLDLEFDEAEQLKHEDGELPWSAAGQSSSLADIAAEAMHPLVVAISQSCQAYSRQSGRKVQGIRVTGGGSRIANCVPWLNEQLRMPVQSVSLGSLDFNKVSHVEGSASGAAKSLGLALLQAGASKHVTTLNFRRGEYAYEGDFKFLQDKLTYLGGLAAALLVVGAVYGFVKNNSLQRVLDTQYETLGEFTKDKLGKTERSFGKTLKKLNRPPSAGEQAELFPPMTAIAVLDKITAIQQGLNGTAIGAHAPGPGGPIPPPTVRAPTNNGRTLQGNPIRARPMALDPAIRPIPAIPGRRGGPRARPSASNPKPAVGKPRFGAPGGKGTDETRLKRPGAAKGEPDAAGDAGAKPVDDQLSKIELSVVNIDVFSDVKVTAETHESNVTGKEIFRKRIEAEPCFVQVKRRDIGEVVSTGRHADWVRFEVTFKVKCPIEGAATAAGEEGGR